MAIGRQWDPFIESQQRVTLFGPYPLQYLFAWFRLYSHKHVSHSLMELLWESSQRFLYEAFERTELAFCVSFRAFIFNLEIVRCSVVLLMDASASSAVEDARWPQKEDSNGAKGEHAEEEQPPGSELKRDIEIGTEKEERHEKTHRGEHVAGSIIGCILGMLVRSWFTGIIVRFLFVALHGRPLLLPRLDTQEEHALLSARSIAYPSLQGKWRIRAHFFQRPRCNTRDGRRGLRKGCRQEERVGEHARLLDAARRSHRRRTFQ